MDWPAAHLSDPAQAAVAELTAGNARFVGMRETAAAGGPDLCVCETSFIPDAIVASQGVQRQTPFAVVFACSDARVPAEIVFDTGPNRLFVVRVAGHVPGDECLGSIEYAARTFAATVAVVAVVGHTGCGAVAAAVASYLSPKSHSDLAFSRSLRAVVNHILVAVRSAALSLEQVWGPAVTADPGYPDALKELAVYLNAGLTAYQLRRELGLGADAPPVVFGVYDLASSRVGFPAAANTFAGRLAPAPADADQLVELGTTLATANAVRVHLTAGRHLPAKGNPPA